MGFPTNPNDCTVEFLGLNTEHSMGHVNHGWYVWAPDYEEIVAGPFLSEAQAEAALTDYVNNWEPPDPPGWEGGFADNH